MAPKRKANGVPPASRKAAATTNKRSKTGASVMSNKRATAADDDLDVFEKELEDDVRVCVCACVRV
jgi:hypothetical protein